MAFIAVKRRRDTAAQWTANNPVLLEGQLGFETDSYTDSGGFRYYKVKFGDGVTAWNDLPYIRLAAIGGGGGGATAFIDLTDVPGAYTGQGGKYLKVTELEDGVEFEVIEAADLPTGIDAAKIGDGSVSNAEFQRINSLTSNAQDQINGKLSNVVEDTTPQLGGDLDAQSNDIQNVATLEIEQYIDLTEIADPANPGSTAGRVYVSDTNGKTNLNMLTSDSLKMRIGRDLISTVRNVSGGTIAAGTIVYISGATGTAPQITPARANSRTTMPAVGVAMESIGNNSFGRIQRFGRTEFSFDTSAWPVGTELYVSASTAGLFTDTKPSYPNFPQPVAVVIVSNVAGSIFVNFTGYYNGHSQGTVEETWKFGATPATGQILAKTATSQRTATFPDKDITVAGLDDLSNYQPLDTELTAFAGLTSAADKLPYFTGSGTMSTADFTSLARNLVALAGPSAVRFYKVNADNTVSLRTAAEMLSDIGAQASGSYLVTTNNLSDLANAGTARTNLGATTVGGNIFTATNPSAVTFIRVNADNTITFRTVAETLSDLGAASSTFIDAISGFVETVADKTYKIVIKCPFACTINETVTMCASGTATATFKINTTALGGTANSVSNSEQTQTHASANSVSAGDDIQITISSNSSCLDMSFTIKITRTI